MTPIFQCYGGSHLYGTQRPTSDVDIRGVFIDDQSRVFCNHEARTVESGGEDTVMHPLRKFHALMVKGNPTIFETAWAPPHKVILMHPIWYRFIEIRSYYTSKNVVSSYIGYLTAQLRDFERNERDAKAFVHAYRLAVQLYDFNRIGALNPVLNDFHRSVVSRIYDRIYTPAHIISVIEEMIQAVRETNTFPEKPRLDVIEPVICEMYMDTYTKGN